MLKLGSNDGAPIRMLDGKLHLNLNPYVIGGIVLYGVSFILYTYLLSKYDLGYIIPLTTGLVYVLIFTASFFIFKEAFTAVKLLGIGLIFVGLIFLNLKV
jgi:multidrug transporter EmrE-like cation transporter